MSRTFLTYLLGVTTVLGVWGICKLMEKSNRIVPPWHPFELRSDLTLDDLVADGYRFSDMPCGMLHFSKTIGDTTIRYYVEFDCEYYKGTYLGGHVWDYLFTDHEVVYPIRTGLDQM